MVSCSALALLVASEANAQGRWTVHTGAQSAAQAASKAAAEQAAAAAAIAQRSQQAIRDAAASVRGMWTVQGQARAAAATAAAAANIARGLADPVAGQKPGLVIDERVAAGQRAGLWIGADLPTEATAGGITTVSVNRTAPRTLTTWKYFNLSSDTNLDFDSGQTGGSVMVRVVGTVSGGRLNASEIWGQIKCTCQLTLLNPGGFRFAPPSKVQARSLIATSLEINHNVSQSALRNPAGALDANYVKMGSGDGFYVPPNETASNLLFIENGVLPNAPSSGTGGYSGMFSMGTVTDGATNIPIGSVEVNAGASIKTLPGENGSGGYVALVGPAVKNAGTIVTQNGQAILAAGSNIILSEPLSTATGTNTALKVTSQEPGQGSTVHGFLYNSAWTSGLPSLVGTARAVNQGVIASIHGAVTFVGDIVEQKGAVLASTSVTRPGSITMSTQVLGSNTATDVLFGERSVTAIVPDSLLRTFESADYAAAFGSFIPVNFDASGGTIPQGTLAGTYYRDNIQPKITITTHRNVGVGADALVVAPSAAMDISSDVQTGTVLLESGSRIDLAGLADVSLPMSANTISILVTANEVADTPLARNLIGQRVTIDARLRGTRADGFQWVGSPLLNASGYVSTIPVSLDEIMTVGGSFKVSGTQNFVQKPGVAATGTTAGKAAASINVSGGYLRYGGGAVNTTLLLGSDGRIYDIGSANPDLSYRVYQPGALTRNQSQPGYITGADAGDVSISAIAPVLQGAIYGDVVTGERQRAGLDLRPTGAALSLTFAPDASGTNPYSVILQPRSAGGTDAHGLSGFSFGASGWTPTLTNNLFPVFTDNLSAGPFNSITIAGQHQLTMKADTSLTVRPGGSIELTGVSLIDGTLNAPSGSITLSGFAFASNQPQIPPTGALVIGPHAVLNVRGLWVNDTRVPFDNLQGSAYIDGGSISISTEAASNSSGSSFVDVTQSIVLAPGSIIDVSSGGYVGTNGKPKLGSDGFPVGAGGSLALRTYSGSWATLGDGAPPSNVSPTSADQAGVMLGGTIYAGGFSGGGTFSLQASRVTIDGATQAPTAYLPQARIDALVPQVSDQLQLSQQSVRSWFTASSGAAHAAPGEVVLPASFFASSGFSSYVLTSRYGGTTVTAGTRVALRQAGFSPDGYTGAFPFSGALVRDFMPYGLARDGLRKPADLTLAQYAFTAGAANGPASRAGVTVEAGARIEGDPGATISLAGGSPVAVFGSLVAQGGDINLFSDPALTSIAGTTNSNTNAANGALAPANAVWIGDDALLDVSGTFVHDPRVATSTAGMVLGGGTITMAGPTIIVQPADAQHPTGAQFMLNGTSATVDVQNAPGLGARTVPMTVWSDGGTLQLAGDHIYFAGSASAHGGAPQAAGGTFRVGQVTVPAGLADYVSQAGTVLEGPNSIVIEPTRKVADALQGRLPNTPALASLSTQAALVAYLRAAQSASVAIPANVGFFEAGSVDGTGPRGLLNNSGFSALEFNTNVIAFAGSVGLKVPGSITMNLGMTDTGGRLVLMPANARLLPQVNANDPAVYRFTDAQCAVTAVNCTPNMGSAVVDISAAYVRISGRDVLDNAFAANNVTRANGTLNVSADWIDLQRNIGITHALNVNLTSKGAVRLLPDNYGFVAVEGEQRESYFGGLFAAGNLTIKGSVVYPATNTQFVLMSTGTIEQGAHRNDTITILQNGTAEAPLSAGGLLALSAQTIVQGGTLWAPLGQIVLGTLSASKTPTELPPNSADATTRDLVDLLPVNTVPTKTVTLLEDSLTSVSAAGLVLPFGYTVDGVTWHQGAPDSSNAFLASIRTVPPEKAIRLFAPKVEQLAGSVVDVSGGGDIYATEFVAGTGGTRNVLTGYQLNLSNGANPVFSPQYPDGRQVYALVPSYLAKVAAFDPTFANYPYFSGQAVPAGLNPASFSPGNAAFANGIAPGASVTITGGSGIPAGTYTLLPGMYATLPGAYRVVQVAGGVSPFAAQNYKTEDGSHYVTGYMGNVLTGTRSALASTFQIQSADVWQKSSQINITSGTTFFRERAREQNIAAPPLPIDGGVLTVGTTGTLKLEGRNNFAAAAGGLGGQLQISAGKILVVAADIADATGFVPPTDTLVLRTDDLAKLGAPSLLIGGTASVSKTTGYSVSATATDLEVRTNADNPLTGSELLLVTAAGGSLGLTVAAGSVIDTIQSDTLTGRDLTIGSAAAGSSDGALIRISSGGPVNIFRPSLPATPAGNVAIGTQAGTAALVDGADVRIGGVGTRSISIDSSGSNTFAAASGQAPGVRLRARNYDLSGSVINLGNAPASTTGLTLSASLIGSFAGAESVRLRSGSFFNLYDAAGLTLGDAAQRIGTLTLSGSGLFHETGGNTTIRADNIVLASSKLAPTATNALTGLGGKLTLDATETITVDVGTTVTGTTDSPVAVVTMSLGGTGSGAGEGSGSFSQIDFAAGKRIAFAGIGSSNIDKGTTSAPNADDNVTARTTNAGVLNAGTANVDLKAPAIVATGGSAQTLVTTGALSIPVQSAEAVTTTLGGMLNLTAGSISAKGTIVASSGAITLTATAGDIDLDAGARISTAGSVVTVLNQTRYAPGGAIRLSADAGAVTIDSGATVDVSAAGQGYAGSLSIKSQGRTTLDGTLLGNAAFKELGGEFQLDAGSLGGSLPLTSFTRSFAVMLEQGDIAIAAGSILNSGRVTLTANGGEVRVDGTIDASGPSGNFISLFGASGVTVESTARLYANFRALDSSNPAAGQGTVNLVQNGGTITLGTSGTPSGETNDTYGYQKVVTSGRIDVKAGAEFDVSGGAGGANISNTGGSVILRAPILTDNTVNAAFSGTLVTNADAGGNASGRGVVVSAYATWSTTDASPAGKHFTGIIDPAGWYGNDGVLRAGTSTSVGNTATGIIINPPANCTACLTRGTLWTPTTPNAEHVEFYQTTLVNFVQQFDATADLTNAKIKVGNGPAEALSLHPGQRNMQPEIVLINPSAGINGGNITVATNWNLGGGTFIGGTYTPSYRVAAGEHKGNAGTLTLRAVNNLDINATITDGFYVAARDPLGGTGLVANLIANQPQMSGAVAEFNTTSAASLMGITEVNKGSFSYDFVAGARFSDAASGTRSVNPHATASATGHVQIDKHTSYDSGRDFGPSGSALPVHVPTMVRTGIGSIRISAGGDFRLLDTLAPGVVYTAGAAADIPAGFTAPALSENYINTSNGLVGTPTWATGGGAVTVTAGQSIIGIQSWRNTSYGVGNTNNPGPAGQLWADWYAHYGKSSGGAAPFAGCDVVACQTAAWINYNTFFQGIGALGGGNITLTAGQDITAIGASLPETLVVSGGRSVDDLPVAHYFGGGNLTVKAGRNLNSGNFLVGRGAGTIEAGGNIQYDPKNPFTGRPTEHLSVSGTNVDGRFVLPLVLAVQDGFINVHAGGSITLGGIYDPASLPSAATVQTKFALQPGGSGTGSAGKNDYWSNPFTTFGSRSGVSMTSTAGNIEALTVSSQEETLVGLFAHGNAGDRVNTLEIGLGDVGRLLPATLNLTALTGDIAINRFDTTAANLLPYPTKPGEEAGNITIAAAGSINLGAGFSMPDLLSRASQFVGSRNDGSLDFANYISPLGIPQATLTRPLHADDTKPVVIAAGRDITFNGLPDAAVNLIKPAQIEAGNDIVLSDGDAVGFPTLRFIGQNHKEGDITSIVAGNDLFGGTYALYGPGSFVLQAGRDMGPLKRSGDAVGGVPTTNGIIAVGNGSNSASRFGSDGAVLPVVPYLPSKSANIYLMFGVKPGVNYQDAIAQYVNPANAGMDGIDFLTHIAEALGKSTADAWTEFQQSSTARQQLLVNQAFLRFLAQVATDYGTSGSPYFGQYGRAYTAINTLFPAGLGYTDNSSGSGLGAAETVLTGRLNIAQSVVATQMGSDINIIGPGGSMIVGSASRDALSPIQQGVLTLAGGAIRSFVDGSILLNQSRILTVQGGNVELFSANGDINAGSGPKTYVSNPPVSLICDQNALCNVNPSGLVSGAGIGALITVPGQDPAASNVTLAAPRGTIDAGAAGLRAEGNLNIVALTIANAYNISVSGASTGVTVAAPAGASTVAAPPPADTSSTRQAGEVTTTQSTSGTQQSIIVVEVLGYGGGDPTGSTEPAEPGSGGAPGGNAEKEEQEKKEEKKDQQEQKPAEQ